MTRPVYQMCLQIGPNHSYGYVFPSETNDVTVSPVFTIPLAEGEDGNSITRERYELLGTLKREVERYTLRHDGEVFLLEHKNLNNPIRFAIYYPFDPLAQRSYLYIRSFPYNGLKKDAVQPYTHFVPIMPIDIHVMDEVCQSHGMVFVWKTDVFGG
jgi:hypothetical protein